MADSAVRPSSDATEPVAAGTRWRTVDIVVTAVLGVAFGVVFWAWNLLWAATGTAFTAFPPAQAFMYGVWLLPAVVAPLIVRKPGAALFAETIASIVSALLGAQWGVQVVLYGLIQGLAGELGFAVFRYRRFGWLQALVAAVLAGAAAAVLDLVYYYPEWTAGWKLTYVVVVVASTVVVCGIAGTALVRALARTGALSSFAAGRSRV
ncbi:MAG TPA: ECF transporter S component [Blastococcus sp.]|jgi:energy-coupling factor transport system substrate-specific component|nr:ECF transporter S component [Blastococcus sp.]